MIVGIGVDLVEIARFGRALTKTPRLEERLFAPMERGLAVESLAARFAAKEAVAKVLGAPGNLGWHDVIVHKKPTGQPELELHGTAQAAAATLGVTRWHISLTHDGGIAMAFVVAESVAELAGPATM